MRTASPYKKHYSQPDAPLPLALLTRLGLMGLLARAHGRYTRWRRQAGRRRPQLVRPLTPGEHVVRKLQAGADELAGLLEPFRRSRSRGHESLRGLLHDLDSRQSVVAQVQALRACMERIAPLRAHQHRRVEAWRSEWPAASAERRQHLSSHERVHEVAALTHGYYLLGEEARRDIDCIEKMLPEAFAAPAAPEPWLDANTQQPSPPAGPTPYSA